MYVTDAVATLHLSALRRTPFRSTAARRREIVTANVRRAGTIAVPKQLLMTSSIFRAKTVDFCLISKYFSRQYPGTLTRSLHNFQIHRDPGERFVITRRVLDRSSMTLRRSRGSTEV